MGGRDAACLLEAELRRNGGPCIDGQDKSVLLRREPRRAKSGPGVRPQGKLWPSTRFLAPARVCKVAHNASLSSVLGIWSELG